MSLFWKIRIILHAIRKRPEHVIFFGSCALFFLGISAFFGNIVVFHDHASQTFSETLMYTMLSIVSLLLAVNVFGQIMLHMKGTLTPTTYQDSNFAFSVVQERV